MSKAEYYNKIELLKEISKISRELNNNNRYHFCGNIRNNYIERGENIFKYMCLVTCRDKDTPKRLILKVLKVFCLLFKE